MTVLVAFSRRVLRTLSAFIVGFHTIQYRRQINTSRRVSQSHRTRFIRTTRLLQRCGRVYPPRASWVPSKVQMTLEFWSSGVARPIAMGELSTAGKTSRAITTELIPRKAWVTDSGVRYPAASVLFDHSREEINSLPTFETCIRRWLNARHRICLVADVVAYRWIVVGQGYLLYQGRFSSEGAREIQAVVQL